MSINAGRRNAQDAFPSSSGPNPLRVHGKREATKELGGRPPLRPETKLGHPHGVPVTSTFAAIPIQTASGWMDTYKELDGNVRRHVLVDPQADDINCSGTSLADARIMRDMHQGKDVAKRTARGLGDVRAVVTGRCPARPFEDRT